jgi:RNA polymerase sigma-70 factor (ECF subfamily)
MAAIHATHAARRETGRTAWETVVALYDVLLHVRPSPLAEVNRAVALAEANGPAAGLASLAALANDARMAGWLPYQAARAGLCAMAGRHGEAADALRAALALEPAPAERRFLERRLAQLS